MRRMILLIVGAQCLSFVLGSGAAYAQTTYPPPSGVSPAVEAASGNQDGTAFTGSEMTPTIWMAVGLSVLGGATLVVARRRARMFLGH
jgi:LPXTG-motif cell wall-anchored protein